MNDALEKTVVCQVSCLTCQNDDNYVFNIIEIIKRFYCINLFHLLAVYMVYLSAQLVHRLVHRGSLA